MTNVPINEPKDFDANISKYRTSEDNHADTFNARLERLVNNQAYLKQLDIITDVDDPAASDDSYKIGKIWINTGSNEMFVCTDNSTGAANWIEISTQSELDNILSDFKATGDIDLDGYNLLNVNKIEYNNNIYGLEWNQTTDSYTRLEGASGLSVPDAGTTGSHSSDFDNLAPWVDIKRVNLSDDGTINAFYGDPDFMDDGSNGQVMVRVPKFYYKVELDEETDRIFRWFISDKPATGFKIHPAFIRNGKENDYIFFSAYEGFNNGGTLESKSGVQPTTDQTISTFRSQAENRGAGWTQQDLLSLSAIKLLYLIEYADFNTQLVLSEGITNLDSGSSNHSQNTGHTSSLGNSSGEVVISSLENGATGASETYAMSYRGIENWYGNAWKFIDGFIIKDDGYYWEEDISNFNNSGSGYTKVGINPITSDGFIDNIEYNKDYLDFEFIAKSTSGSSSTYIPDYQFSHDSGEVNIALSGGYWYDGSLAGGFNWRLANVASISSRDIGARLLYIPNN